MIANDPSSFLVAQQQHLCSQNCQLPAAQHQQQRQQQRRNKYCAAMHVIMCEHVTIQAQQIEWTRAKACFYRKNTTDRILQFIIDDDRAAPAYSCVTHVLGSYMTMHSTQYLTTVLFQHNFAMRTFLITYMKRIIYSFDAYQLDFFRLL